MNRLQVRKFLFGGALVVALVGAGLASRNTDAASSLRASTQAPPPSVSPFDLADLLSKAPPDVVVMTFDDAKHALLGAVPVSAFGADDAALLKNAPKARRIVLVGRDPVRMDRIARQLDASGRHVRVLAGGTEAWDTAMDVDPPAPPATAELDAWNTYRQHVALRRAFGDTDAAPPTPVAAPVVPVPEAPASPKKREGC
jgi:rhodanese-related sulfurtransferase